MTKRERVLTALNHKEPDMIPWDLTGARACKITKGFYLNLLDYLGLPELKKDIRVSNFMTQAVVVHDEVLEKLGCDVAEPEIAWVKDPENPPLKSWEDSEYLYQKTEFDATYRMPKNAQLYYDPYIPALGEDEEEDKAYRFPNPEVVAQHTIDDLKKFRAAGYATVFSRTYGEGFLTHGYDLYGMQNWMMMFYEDEDRIHKILRRYCDKKLEWWSKLLEKLGDNLDVVCLSDDWGSQNSLLISSDLLEEFVIPYTQEEINLIKSKSDCKILFHNDGAIFDMIPKIIDMGVDILNPVQFSAKGMDVKRVKETYGKDICFWGAGIDTQHTLWEGNKQQVQDMVKENMEIMGKDGGFVFSTVHNIQPNVPVENFVWMWEAFMKNRNY